MTIRERYGKVLARFAEIMPSPHTELEYDTPFHLLVAVILSAQCTDKRVNIVTPGLFKRFPSPREMASVEPEEVFPYISSVSFPNNKARHLVKAARLIVEKFEGEVPDDINSLMELPGVGRKTANVMLAVVWDRAAMAVDTHVFRVSNRIGLTRDSKTLLATERTLVRHIPAHLLSTAHHWLILHGRYVCKARTPLCGECAISEYCRHNTGK